MLIMKLFEKYSVTVETVQQSGWSVDTNSLAIKWDSESLPRRKSYELHVVWNLVESLE